MNKFSTELFFNTTQEDEQNYFFGEIQLNINAFMGQEQSLLPGNYRVIDGQLCRIISGLPVEEVRNRLRLAT